MNKKVLRVITIICTVLVMICISTPIFAALDPTGLNGQISNDVNSFDNIGKNIVGAIRAIGTIISVGVLMVLGIKYMMGSSEEKAEYKKTMIPYLIGAILLFAASNIAQMVYNFAITVK